MLLNYNKPKKKRSTDEHNGMYQSDTGICPRDGKNGFCDNL